jgi:uridine kinase
MGTNMTPYIIGIAGPSGAGKSLICRLVQSTFDRVSRLKFDDFFKDAADVPLLDSFIRWDHPSSIKWEELITAAKDLRAGEAAMVPNYSRVESKMIGEKCVFPAPIILLDGYQCLYKKELRDLMDLKIYFHLSEGSQIRRRRERQPWVQDGYLHSVMIPDAREFLFPTKQYADYVVNAEMSAQAVADVCLAIIRNRLGDRLKKLESRERFCVVRIHALV